MFDIEYKGGNCVVISTKKSTLVCDPDLSVVGLKNLPLKDAVELATEPRLAVNSPEARLSIEGPGEYEIGEFSIQGVSATRHIDTTADEPLSTLYRIEIGDVRLALIGNITGKLDEAQLEHLGVVDVVIVPVGGGGLTLDAASAAAVVRQINPKIAIPVHYHDASLKYDTPQDSVETFVSELGAPLETGTKYKLKNNSTLPPVLTTVVISRN